MLSTVNPTRGRGGGRVGPEAPDCMGQIEATAPKPCSGARRRRHRVGLQSQDKSGTGGSQAAGPGPPSQPHVQDKLLPMQGTRAPRWHSRGARAAGVWQWGHCATRCAPGWGCSPEIPQGLRQSKLTFPQHPRPKPLSKALCPAHAGGVQGQVGSRAASPLLLRPSKAAAPEPVTRTCHPNLGLAALEGQEAASQGRTRHTPALGTGTARTIFGDGLEPAPALLPPRQPRTGWEGLFPPASSWQQEVPSISEHTWPQT